MLLRAIFFDAGNTLVFPNLERTLAPLHARGIRPEREQLHAAERTAKRKLDAGELAGNGNSVVRFISSIANAALTSISLATRISDLYTRS